MLTAVDAALMVIDAANGVEAQTLRLLEVCRSRGTPIITFINKMDREVREPLDLIDEIERVLGMAAVPFSWPIGMGKSFHGVYDLAEDRIRVFRPGEDRLRTGGRRSSGTRPSFAARALRRRVRARAARHRAGARGHTRVLARGVPRGQTDAGVLRLGDQQLRRARSARRAGGHRAAAATARRAAGPGRAGWRALLRRGVQDPGQHGSGASRPRGVRARVLGTLRARHARCKIQRTGKEFRPNNVVSFLSQRRELLDEAYAGDIIGIPTHGGIQLGDTLTDGADAAVHRAAVLRAGDLPLHRGGESAARQAASHRAAAARRGRRDPGVPPVAQHHDAAGRGREPAVRGRGAPAAARIRRGGAHDAGALHLRALGVGRRSGGARRSSWKPTPGASRAMPPMRSRC